MINIPRRYFQLMYDLIPIGELGNVSIEKVDDQITLKIDGQSWMNNHVGMDGSHNHLYRNAVGEVLLVGLGLGCDVITLRDKPEVTKIDVVEINQNVIDLVAPFIRHPKVTILHQNIFTWIPARRYDIIWFDLTIDDISFHSTERAIMQTRGDTLVRPGGNILFWNPLNFQSP